MDDPYSRLAAEKQIADLKRQLEEARVILRHTEADAEQAVFHASLDSKILDWIESAKHADMIHCDANGGFFIDGFPTKPTLRAAIHAAIGGTEPKVANRGSSSRRGHLLPGRELRSQMEMERHSQVSDKRLLDLLDRMIKGNTSVRLWEEDGGLIATVDMPKVQNSYVGGTLREALEELLKEQFPPYER